MTYSASLTIEGVARGSGLLTISESSVTWASSVETVSFNYSEMALHAYSLDPAPHLLIQLLTDNEDEAGAEILIGLGSREEAEAAFQAMNSFSAKSASLEISSDWVSAEDLVSV
jgi:hypothetical protein